MNDDDENDSAAAHEASDDVADNGALPWEDTLILAFRDMQWDHALSSAMNAAARLAALLRRGPGTIHKLDDGAEWLGDVIASSGAGRHARFFLLEFKSARAKRSTEYAKPMLIGAVARLILPQHGDAAMIACGDQCHFAVFANAPGLAEPADLDEPANREPADAAADAQRHRPIDRYEQRVLLAEPYFDWVRQGVRSVLRKPKPGKPDSVEPAIRRVWAQRDGSPALTALAQFAPKHNDDLHKLAEVIWGGPGHGLPLPAYKAYIRWLAGLAGDSGEHVKVKLVAVTDGALHYCLTTIGALALRFEPASLGATNKMKKG